LRRKLTFDATGLSLQARPSGKSNDPTLRRGTWLLLGLWFFGPLILGQHQGSLVEATLAIAQIIKLHATVHVAAPSTGRKPKQIHIPRRYATYVDHLRPLVLLALNTGMRRSELFQLRWADINLKTRWLTVHGRTAKSKQTRRLPLNREALMVLEGWQAQSIRRQAILENPILGHVVDDQHRELGRTIPTGRTPQRCSDDAPEDDSKACQQS
jgi:integrase